MIATGLIDYYEEFRTALFITGFTLGAFLFSMKAMIIKAMKDDYYDKIKYQLQIKALRERGCEGGYYTNLGNFSRLLIKSIWVSFGSSLLQITLGYWSNVYAVMICLAMAAYSWSLVGRSIFHVSENWKSLIDLAEAAAIELHEIDSENEDNVS